MVVVVETSGENAMVDKANDDVVITHAVVVAVVNFIFFVYLLLLVYYLDYVKQFLP